MVNSKETRYAIVRLSEHFCEAQQICNEGDPVWLYLIVIGIPSAARNLWDRIAHSEWDYADRIKWYYSSFPEKIHALSLLNLLLIYFAII